MGDEDEKDGAAAAAFMSWMEGTSQAMDKAAGLVTDLWVIMIDKGDGHGERVGAAPTVGGVIMLMVSPDVSELECIDLAHLARGEQATVRLRHFRACHDQSEHRP